MGRPLTIALLLITGGGFMDAYTYVAFDHVFTNAQSGNVVLLAVHAARAEWAEAWKHVPALAAFFPGILAGRAILARGSVGGVAADAVVLGLQFLILVSVGAAAILAPGAAAAGTAAISFAFAMQNTAFEKVGTVSYTSVVTTGNLRSFCEAVHAGWLRDEAEARRKATVLGPLCAGFAVGALAGAATSSILGPAAIVCPITVLAFALLACLRSRAP